MTKMVNVKVNGRWDIKLPEHRADRPEWYTEAGWEKARLDHIFSTTQEGDIVYYVGAEEGDMCGLLAQWFAELVMFEPNPAVWSNIKAIWEVNRLKPPVVAFAGFAGARSDDPIPEIKQNGFPESADGPIIAEHGFKNLCEADGTIPIISIDDMVKATGEVPDMISIDVEGGEFEVLKGAEQTLREHHPRIYLSLHPEFLYEIYNIYSADVRHWIKELGYKETLLAYDHEVHLVYERVENA